MSFFLFLGALVVVASGIWLLVLAFKEHILWGLGSLFVPFVSLVFVIMHWRRAWIPFVTSFAGVGMIVIGIFSSLPSYQAIRDLAAVHSELAHRIELGEMSEAEAGRELIRISQAMLLGEDYSPELKPLKPRVPSRASTPRPRPEQGAIEPGPALGEAAPAEPPTPTPKQFLIQEYKQIEFRDASAFVGQPARVSMRSGLVREGLLGPPDPRHLTLVHRVPGGDISYHIEPDTAERIEVLAWVELWE